ncbi:MAG: hypothetical protein RPS47_06135 [Colwellia sp.]|jgi:hypothetical protein
MKKRHAKQLQKLIQGEMTSSLIEVRRKKGKTTYTVKTSKKDAIKGAAVGATIGFRVAGPAGAAVGAGVMGTIGFVFGEPD